jgi:hypothetical protein
MPVKHKILKLAVIKYKFKWNNKYRRASQCIRLTRSPGKTNKAPVIPHHTAKQSFKINFEAGPLKLNILKNLLVKWIAIKKKNHA